jgi:hypothetical protein
VWWNIDTVPPLLDWNTTVNTTLQTDTNTICVNASEPVNCTLTIGATPHINSTFAPLVCWTHTFSDGNHSLQATCEDIAGNDASISAWIYTDATLPEVDWNWPDANSTTSYNASTARLNASEPVNCTLYVNGTPHPNSTLTDAPSWALELPDGNHSINATCKDIGGNPAQAGTVWWNIDTVPPLLDWNTTVNTTLQTDTNTICVNASEPVTCTLAIGATPHINSTFAPLVCWTHTFSDGNHSLQATCEDIAGNDASISAWLEVDTVGPIITWDWPDINSTIGINQTLPGAILNEPANCTLNFNESPFPNATLDTSFYWLLQDLEEGNYTANVSCDDLAGNPSTSSPAWLVVDSTPPQINIISPPDGSPTNDPTPTITFNTSDNIAEALDYEVYVDSLPALHSGSGRAPIGITSIDILSGFSTLGEHNVTIVVTDDAGNSANDTITLHLIPPVVYLMNPGYAEILNDSQQDFSFKVIDTISTRLDCSFYLNGVLNQSARVDNNSISIFSTGVEEANDQNWTISCQNSIPFSSSDTWPFSVDLTPPYVALYSPSGGLTNNADTLINATAVDANLANITINAYASGLYYNKTCTYSPCHATINLPDGYYNINATAWDLAGHSNSTASIDIEIDTQPPILTWTSPVNTTSHTSPVILQIGSDEALSSCTIEINGINRSMEGALTQFSYTWHPPAGNSSLRAYCSDLAGNPASIAAWHNNAVMEYDSGRGGSSRGGAWPSFGQPIQIPPGTASIIISPHSPSLGDTVTISVELSGNPLGGNLTLMGPSGRRISLMIEGSYSFEPDVAGNWVAVFQGEGHNLEARFSVSALPDSPPPPGPLPPEPKPPEPEAPDGPEPRQPEGDDWPYIAAVIGIVALASLLLYKYYIKKPTAL